MPRSIKKLSIIKYKMHKAATDLISNFKYMQALIHESLINAHLSYFSSKKANVRGGGK